MAPDAILAISELSPNDYTYLTDDPDSPDANDLVASGNNVNTSVRTSFGAISGSSLDETASAQEFRAAVEQFDEGQSGTPDARLELWESGTLVRAGSDTPVGTGGVVLSLSWSASELGGSSPWDGANVECRVVGTKTGGSPTARNTVNVLAVEWNAETVSTLPGEVSEPASVRIALPSEDQAAASARIALPSEDQVVGSARIALPGQVAGAASVNISVGLAGEVSAAASVDIALQRSYTASLTAVSDPLTHEGHQVRVRYAKDVAGGQVVGLEVWLCQGTTRLWRAVQLMDVSSTTPTTTVEDVPTAVAATITDYSDLALEFVSLHRGGTPQRRVHVTWANVLVPTTDLTAGQVAAAASVRLQVPSEVSAPASARVALKGEAAAAASARIALPGAQAASATVRIALPSETAAAASARLALRGQASSPASVRVAQAGQAAAAASVNILVSGEGQVSQPASVRIAQHGQATGAASVRVAARGDTQAPGSVRVARQAQVWVLGSVLLALPAQASTAASARVAQRGQAAAAASARITLVGEVAAQASANIYVVPVDAVRTYAPLVSTGLRVAVLAEGRQRAQLAEDGRRVAGLLTDGSTAISLQTTGITRAAVEGGVPFYVKQHNLEAALAATLEDEDGNAINLAGKTLRFKMAHKDGGKVVVDYQGAAIVVTDAPNGVVEYRWVAGDTGAAGEFDAEFEIVDAGGASRPMSVPNAQRGIRVVVTETLAE
jgi:hypothetical protein